MEEIIGLGPKAITSIFDYLNKTENVDEINKLAKHCKINNYKNIISKSPFNNKLIIFTGKLTHMSREEAKQKAIDNGAKISNFISKKTDYLIYGEKAGSKLKKAKDLKILLLSEKEWMSML